MVEKDLVIHVGVQTSIFDSRSVCRQQVTHQETMEYETRKMMIDIWQDMKDQRGSRRCKRLLWRHVKCIKGVCACEVG